MVTLRVTSATRGEGVVESNNEAIYLVGLAGRRLVTMDDSKGREVLYR